MLPDRMVRAVIVDLICPHAGRKPGTIAVWIASLLFFVSLETRLLALG